MSGCCSSWAVTVLAICVCQSGTSTFTELRVHFGQSFASVAWSASCSITVAGPVAYDVIAMALNGCPLCCAIACSAASVASSAYGSSVLYVVPARWSMLGVPP